MLRSLFSGISGLRSHQTDDGRHRQQHRQRQHHRLQVVADAVPGHAVARSCRTRAAPSRAPVAPTRRRSASASGVAGITTNFTQGASQITGRSTDMMIQGDGFFVVRKGAEQLYTRAGVVRLRRDRPAGAPRRAARSCRAGRPSTASSTPTARCPTCALPTGTLMAAVATDERDATAATSLAPRRTARSCDRTIDVFDAAGQQPRAVAGLHQDRTASGA